jgi:hypothetical protein
MALRLAVGVSELPQQAADVTLKVFIDHVYRLSRVDYLKTVVIDH